MKRLLILGFGLLLLAPAAHAGGFFIGASVLEAGVEIDEVDFDEDDTGFKVFGGYRFFKFFALEGGYYDFGEPGDSSGEFEITALNASAKGTLPIGKRIELFAKVGLYQWDVEASTGADEDDNDVGYGAGIAVLLGKRVELRAEYEMVELDDEADLDIISVGAAFRF